MNQTTRRALTVEDQLISKMTLSFLFTPLFLLLLAGAMIAL